MVTEFGQFGIGGQFDGFMARCGAMDQQASKKVVIQGEERRQSVRIPRWVQRLAGSVAIASLGLLVACGGNSSQSAPIEHPTLAPLPSATHMLTCDYGHTNLDGSVTHGRIFSQQVTIDADKDGDIHGDNDGDDDSSVIACPVHADDELLNQTTAELGGH